MDSYTTNKFLLLATYFLLLPNLLYYTQLRLDSYYICFANYIFRLRFLLHNQIVPLEILYFLCFRLEKPLHIYSVHYYRCNRSHTIVAFSSCFTLYYSCYQFSIRISQISITSFVYNMNLDSACD